MAQLALPGLPRPGGLLTSRAPEGGGHTATDRTRAGGLFTRSSPTCSDAKMLGVRAAKLGHCSATKVDGWCRCSFSACFQIEAAKSHRPARLSLRQARRKQACPGLKADLGMHRPRQIKARLALTSDA